MNSGSVVIRPAEEYQRIHERLTLSPTRQTKIARDRELGHKDGLNELSRGAAEVAKKVYSGTSVDDLTEKERDTIRDTEYAINQRAYDRSAVKSTLKPVFGGVRRVGNEILKKMEEIKSITQELEEESAEHQITADRKNSLHLELLAAEKFIEQKNAEINLLKSMLSETKNTTSAPAQKMTEIGVSNLKDSLDETRSRIGEMESKVKEQIENIKRSQFDQSTSVTPAAAQVVPQQIANTPATGPEQINDEEKQIENIHNELQTLLTPAWNKYKYLEGLDLSTLRDHKDDISRLATLTSDAENRGKNIFDEFNNSKEYSNKAKRTLGVIYSSGKQSRRPFVSYLIEINNWLDVTLKTIQGTDQTNNQVAPVATQTTTTTQTATTQPTSQISTTQQASEPVPASTPAAEPTVAAVENKQEAKQEKERQALGRTVAAAVETIKRYRQNNPEATQKLIDVVYQLNVDAINRSSIDQSEKDALIEQLNVAKRTRKKEPAKPKVYGDAAARVEKIAAKTTGTAAKSEVKPSAPKTETKPADGATKPEAKKFGLGSVAIATALGAAAALATPAILNNDKPATNEAAAQPGESAPVKIGDMTLYTKDKYLLFTSGNVSTKLVFESVESGNGYYLAKMRSGDLIKNIAIPSQTTLPEFKAAADADSRLAVASTLADRILANNPIMPGVTVLTTNVVNKQIGNDNVPTFEAYSFKRQSGEVVEAKHAAVEIKENPIAKEIFGKKYDQYVARFRDISLAQFRRMSDEDIKGVKDEVKKIGEIGSPFIKNGEREASSVEELLNLASQNKIS